MPLNSDWAWQNWYTTSNSTSATIYPYSYAFVQQPQPLASVADAPAELSDREWLDAQIAEVCDLARAA